MSGISMSGKGGRSGMPIAVVAGQRHKIVSVLLWLGGVFTTYLFISTAAAGRYEEWQVVTAAFVMQTILTVLESDFIRGMRSEVSVFAIVVDTLLNAAGLWTFITGIDQSTLWLMLSEVFGVGGNMSAWAAGVIAMVLGYMLAIAPEKVWR